MRSIRNLKKVGRQPFVLSRIVGVGLVEQMVAGIKEAISCGHFATSPATRSKRVAFRPSLVRHGVP